MNYKIIQDEQLLDDYIDNFLLELQQGEAFMLILFSRKKYVNSSLGLKSDKEQLKRVVCTSKNRIKQKIRQMEIEIGNYLHDNILVPQESLALYITPNPRDLIKAGKNTCKELMELIFKGDKHFNPSSIALSNIQSSSSRKEWMIFDIDIKSIPSYSSVLKVIIQNSCGDYCNFKIIETFGGYHLYIKLDTIEESKRKTWYKEIMKIPNIDQHGDLLSPVVGCCQSFHIPKFI